MSSTAPNDVFLPVSGTFVHVKRHYVYPDATSNMPNPAVNVVTSLTFKKAVTHEAEETE